MKKKTLILTIVAAVVILGAALVLVLGFWRAKNEAAEEKASNYAAVYLTTGDVYFGKLDWLPWPRLKNVWYLQRGQQLGVAPFKNVVWQPMDEIYLNPQQITFWTKIKAGSDFAKALENSSTEQAPALQAPASQPSQPSASPK